MFCNQTDQMNIQNNHSFCVYGSRSYRQRNHTDSFYNHCLCYCFLHQVSPVIQQCSFIHFIDFLCEDFIIQMYSAAFSFLHVRVCRIFAFYSTNFEIWLSETCERFLVKKINAAFINDTRRSILTSLHLWLVKFRRDKCVVTMIPDLRNREALTLQAAFS